MTIAVPQEFQSFVESLVARGRFFSEHEILVESLRLLHDRGSLAEEIQKGFEQIELGQCVDGPIAIAKLRDRLKPQLGSYGSGYSMQAATSELLHFDNV
jgi:Arc/MetJ-type ribon-helix-helix transcriptional regulator